MKVFTTNLYQNLMIKIKKQQTDIDTKPPNVFDYLKSLSQEAKDLIDVIKDADNDIGKYNLVFIASNREKFNFNIFRMPLDFLKIIRLFIMEKFH